MDDLESLERHTSIQEDIIQYLEKQKDQAYDERDRLVCALSKIFPSVLMYDLAAEDYWHWVVCVRFPTQDVTQATWHIHDSELEWFDHLDRIDDSHPEWEEWKWDGHTTEEKYKRLQEMSAPAEQERRCL